MTKGLKLTKEQKVYIKNQAELADKSIFHIDPIGLRDYIQKGETLVFYGAHWCMLRLYILMVLGKYTQLLTPQWLQFQQWYQRNNAMHSIRICKVECGDADEICAKQFQVEEFPTIIRYKDGKKIEEYNGEENAVRLYYYMGNLTASTNVKGYPSISSLAPKATTTLSSVSYNTTQKKKYVLSKGSTRKSRLVYKSKSNASKPSPSHSSKPITKSLSSKPIANPMSSQPIAKSISSQINTIIPTKPSTFIGNSLDYSIDKSIVKSSQPPKETSIKENKAYSSSQNKEIIIETSDTQELLHRAVLEKMLIGLCLLILVYFIFKRVRGRRWIRNLALKALKRS